MRSGDQWRRVATLSATGGTAGEQFGVSVALAGDLAAPLPLQTPGAALPLFRENPPELGHSRCLEVRRKRILSVSGTYR